jgi:hypothetical protein
VIRISELGTTLLLVTANAVSSSPILVTLMTKALNSSETSAAQRKIPEDGILHSHRRENLKSYKLWRSLSIFFTLACFSVSINVSEIFSLQVLYTAWLRGFWS